MVKGQVFLVIGIIILLSFILLKVATIPIPKEEILLKESFLDLKAEYAKTIDLTLVRQPPNPAQTLELNLDNFAKFSSDAFKQKNFEQKLLYSFTYNGSEVAVGNFLGQDISDVEICLNEMNCGYVEYLKNGQSALRNLTRAENFVVNISYKIDNEQKSFTYSGTTEDTVASYFDLWLSYEKSFFKDIFLVKRKITTLMQEYVGYGKEINYTALTEITEPFVIIISHSAGDTLSGFITISGVASYGSTIETITDTGFSGSSTGLTHGSLMLDNSLTGEFISDPIKTDRYIMWATLDWDAELNNQTLEFWIKTENSAWSKAIKGEKVYFGSGKELQYMVKFTTTDISVSPVLHQVTLRYAIPNSEKEPIVKVRVDGIEGIATKSSFDPKTGILDWIYIFDTSALKNGAYQISAYLYEEGVAIAVEEDYVNIVVHNELLPEGEVLPTCPFGCKIIESGTTDDLYGVGMGSALLTGASGRLLKYDDIKTLSPVKSGTTRTLYKVDFRPPEKDYALIAAGAEKENTPIYIFNISAETMTSLESKYETSFRATAWRPQGDYGLIVGDQGRILRYDAATKSITPLDSGRTEDLKSVAFSPDGSYALISGTFQLLLKYDGKESFSVLLPPSRMGGALNSIAWRPQGDYGLIVGYDWTGSSGIRKYNGVNFTGVGSRIEVILNAIAFHPSGNYSLLVGDSGKMWKYDGKEFTEIQTGTTANLFDVKWKNDGCYALAVGSGGTVVRYSCLLGISDVNVTQIPGSAAVISFKTNDPGSNSQADVWLSDADPSTNTTFQGTTNTYKHSIVLTGLKPWKMYNYQIYVNNSCFDEVYYTGTFRIKPSLAMPELNQPADQSVSPADCAKYQYTLTNVGPENGTFMVEVAKSGGVCTNWPYTWEIYSVCDGVWHYPKTGTRINPYTTDIAAGESKNLDLVVCVPEDSPEGAAGKYCDVGTYIWNVYMGEWGGYETWDDTRTTSVGYPWGIAELKPAYQSYKIDCRCDRNCWGIDLELKLKNVGDAEDQFSVTVQGICVGADPAPVTYTLGAGETVWVGGEFSYEEISCEQGIDICATAQSAPRREEVCAYVEIECR